MTFAVENSSRPLFCFDAYHVDTQHLAREGMVHDSWDDLLPIRRDLTIVDLPIVPVGDPDDNGCARCHGDGCLEVLLVDGVPDQWDVFSRSYHGFEHGWAY